MQTQINGKVGFAEFETLQGTVRTNWEKMEKNKETFENFENKITIRVDSIEEKLNKTANDTDINKMDLKRQREKFTDFYDYTQSCIRQFKEQDKEYDEKHIDIDIKL